jgi:4'-phosphopantetheinyl transferase
MPENLSPGDVHVWYLWTERVVDTECLRRHTRILSNDERTRAESFRFEEDRNSHILSKAFVRILLSRYISIDPSAWEFTRNQHGKPAISGPSSGVDIRFNVSHTRGLIVGVFTLNSAIGIDAENHHQRVDALSIAHDYLSPAEYSALRELKNSDRQRRFLEFWTLKEAYAKAHGLGMSMDLTQFTFDIDADAATISFTNKDQATDPTLWRFRLLRPGSHHTVAVAVRGDFGTDIKLGVYDGTSLMQ